MSPTVQLILQLVALFFAAVGGYSLRVLREPETVTEKGGEK